MQTILAVLVYTLSLFGFHVGGTSWSHRVTSDQGDALYSKAWAKDGMAHFECVQSSSGRCWYTVFPDDCTDARCNAKPIARFAIARGARRDFTGLADFRFCVARDAEVPPPDCRERG